MKKVSCFILLFSVALALQDHIACTMRNIKEDHSSALIKRHAGHSHESYVHAHDPMDRSIRIGALFTILVTSALGVILPSLMQFIGIKRYISPTSWIPIFFRQFGAGVVLSTATIHLITHSYIYASFPSVAVKIERYEATVAAFILAGIYITLIFEVCCMRYLKSNPIQYDNNNQEKDIQDLDDSLESSKHEHGANISVNQISLFVFEAGIVFHSVIIGLTATVVSDKQFKQYFAVLVFHQMFEGMALGSRIAELPRQSLSWLGRFCYCFVFAVITPIGMAIGLGVMKFYNDSSFGTAITQVILQGISAGILLWVALIELVAVEYFQTLKNCDNLRVTYALVCLTAGCILMSIIGNWI